MPEVSNMSMKRVCSGSGHIEWLVEWFGSINGICGMYARKQEYFHDFTQNPTRRGILRNPENTPTSSIYRLSQAGIIKISKYAFENSSGEHIRALLECILPRTCKKPLGFEKLLFFH